MNDVCIIIPVFNFPELTDRCLKALRENEDMPFDVLIVDDCSAIPYASNGSAVLRLETNSGFTNATNRGILWCGDRYKYIHLLNNDTIPYPNFIKELYTFMENDPVVGIASSVKYVIADGRKCTELYGIDLTRGYHLLLDEWAEPEDSRWEGNAIYCDWTSLSSALIRMDMIRQIGLLDQRFKHYCSDSEYCIRANQNDWNVAVVQKSIVEHQHQSTIKHIDFNPHVDQKLFIDKLIGVKTKSLMERLPLDHEANTWGKLSFETEQR